MHFVVTPNPYNLELLRRHQEWSTLAQMELDRRRAVLIGALPDELLEAIAAGELNISELAGQIGR